MRTEFWLESVKGKEPVRPWRTWEDNIRMDVREMRWKCGGRIHVAQDRDQ